MLTQFVFFAVFWIAFGIIGGFTTDMKLDMLLMCMYKVMCRFNLNLQYDKYFLRT